jgi:hypothetical protein
VGWAVQGANDSRIYKENALPAEILADAFGDRNQQTDSKTYMETQKT